MMSIGFDLVSWYFGQLHNHLVLALAPLAIHWGLLAHQVSPDTPPKFQPQKTEVEHKADSDIPPIHDYVQDFLRESANEWNGLINHPYPRSMAKGTTPLNGFRHHCIQDAIHFDAFYRVRMEALARTGTFQELKDSPRVFTIGFDAVSKAHEECTTQLGVPKSVVAKERNSKSLQDWIDFVSKVANKGDYLDVIIALLPGILSGDQIANELLRDPDTIRNTLYFTMWIQPYTQNPIKKHIKYVNEHIGSLSQKEREKRWRGWVNTFKQGCVYETDFFGLGLESGRFPAYEIVSDGIYKIRSYRRGNPHIVSSEPSSVTIQDAEPHEEGLWKLTNSPDGYTVENLARKGYLSVSVSGPPQLAYGVGISTEEYRWSINPVKVKGANGYYKAYQLHVPEGIQYVLGTAMHEGDEKVVAGNNSQISTQLWLLDRVEV